MSEMDELVKEVAFDALREMYSEADPPLDFDHALENPNEYGDQWYQDHYLSYEKQHKIVEKHCTKHGLGRREKTQVNMIAIVDYGPTSTNPNE